jgi:hypothetical protein
MTVRFRWINDREVLESPDGGPALWRCPQCQWWQKWEEEQCAGCGTLRDGVKDQKKPQ